MVHLIRMRYNPDLDRAQDIEPDESINLGTIWSVLKDDVKKNAWYIVVDCLLIFVTSGLSFVEPILTRRIVDVAVPHKDVRAVVILSSLMVIVAVFSRALAAVMSLLRTKFNYLMQSSLQARALKRALNAPLKVSSKMATGDILTIINADTSSLILGLGTIFRNVVGSLYSLVLAAILLWKTSPVMLLLAVVASCVRFPIQRWIARTAREQNRARQQWMSRTSTTVVESFTGLNTVKVYGLEDIRCENFIDTLKKAFEATFSLEGKLQALGTLDTFLNYAVPAAIYGYGGYLIIAGRSTVGAVLAAVQYMNSGLTSFGGLIGIYAQLKPLYVHMERLQKVLQMPDEYSEGQEPHFDLIKEMSFSGVHFKHEQQDDVLLKGIDLELEKGKIIGLVGPSGGGKTTMGYLAAGVFKPVSGRISVNGVDISSLSMKWYREKVALVTDGDFMFTGTILDNLKLVKPCASEEEINRCLHMSLFDQVVPELPQGLNTLVGRTGVTLSSGQRQRLSLARAILRDPQVVVLDEITSNLDPELERHLKERLMSWMRERVVLLISHRLSTIAWADRVLELRDGQISDVTGKTLDLQEEPRSKGEVARRITALQRRFQPPGSF